jgi:predicted transposase YdaD
LMGAKKDMVAAQAKSLIEQARTESNNDTTLKVVLELVNTIFVYKFPELTRQEIETMVRHEAQWMNEYRNQEVTSSILCSVRG